MVMLTWYALMSQHMLSMVELQHKPTNKDLKHLQQN